MNEVKGSLNEASDLTFIAGRGRRVLRWLDVRCGVLNVEMFLQRDLAEVVQHVLYVPLVLVRLVALLLHGDCLRDLG